MDEIDSVLSRLTRPEHLWSRSECLSRPSPVPATAGLYGWYFRELPPGVDGNGCVRREEFTLLYVGIAPSRPLGHNGLRSTSSLRSRIRMHYAGSAEGSTLRLSLGALLAKKLGLRRDPTSTSKSFGEGEVKLSNWMEANACVTWVEQAEPWSIETSVIARLYLPFNLAHNRDHPFWAHLTRSRSRQAQF